MLIRKVCAQPGTIFTPGAIGYVPFRCREVFCCEPCDISGPTTQKNIPKRILTQAALRTGLAGKSVSAYSISFQLGKQNSTLEMWGFWLAVKTSSRLGQVCKWGICYINRTMLFHNLNNFVFLYITHCMKNKFVTIARQYKCHMPWI